MAIERQNGTVMTDVTVSDSLSKRVVTEEHSEECIDMEDKKIEGPHATVGVHLGMTLNLGNYESAKVDISCTLPCAPDDASLSDAHARARQFASDKLKEAVAGIKSKSKK